MRIDDLPPPHEYWNRPPSKTQGDGDPSRLYMTVGLCLSQWESIENHFSVMFQTFIDSDSHGAKRAYGSIVSAGGRRDALREAAAVFFSEWRQIPKIEQERFKNLLNHFGTASGKRNDIAHGIVQNIRVHIGEREDGGWFLLPADYNSSKNKAFVDVDIEDTWSLLRAQYRYTADDLSYFYGRFGDLALASEEYITAIRRGHLKR